MFSRPPCGLFITGTNTDAGKTYVAAMIVRQLRAQGFRVGVYKPVASGCVDAKEIDGDWNNDRAAAMKGNHTALEGSCVSQDAVTLWESAGRPRCLDDVCPQRFLASITPHLAAIAEGKKLDRALVSQGISAWANDFEIVIVEGAGGLMTPLDEDDSFADLAAELGYPMIVVAPNLIGVINQTLQTLVVADNFGDGLPVAGIVLNDVAADLDASADSNEQQIAHRTVVPVLSRVGFGATEFADPIDWMAMAQRR